MPTHYQLADAEEINKKNPTTFWIPSKEDRENVPVGGDVKLIFSNRGGRRGERMWVIVTERHDDGSYSGTLNNDPAFLTCVKYNQLIKFEPKHIINILTSGLQQIMDEHAAVLGVEKHVAHPHCHAEKIVSKRKSR